MASKDDLNDPKENPIYPGVRYREHPTRKVGLKKDRQWIIIQKLGSKRYVSTLGWWSEGIKQGDAIKKADEYKANHKWNKANPDQPPKPICKQDEDKAAAELAAKLEQERKEQERKNITFGEFFKTVYLPLQIENGKKSVKREQSLFSNHLDPVLGSATFQDIKAFNIEAVKKRMKGRKQSKRSIQYALALIRQVWNLAIREEITERVCPTKQVKKPTIHNEKDRFFTPEEEQLLLAELKKRSQTIHDMAIMSLDTGARWSELARLEWNNVDLINGSARLLDTKAGNDHKLTIGTTRVREMLQRRKQEAKSEYVFPKKNGEQQKEVSSTFYRTVKDLGFNDGKKRLERLGFHSLRHTFASRLVLAGVSLYKVKELLNHHSITMTERYAHLREEDKREALQNLEQQPDNVIQLPTTKNG